jgi:hypothetical protein
MDKWLKTGSLKRPHESNMAISRKALTVRRRKPALRLAASHSRKPLQQRLPKNYIRM